MSNEFHYQYVTINVERYFKSAASETKIKFRSFGRWTIILNLYQNWGYYKDFEISNILEDKAEEWFRNVNICIVYWIVFERCRYPPLYHNYNGLCQPTTCNKVGSLLSWFAQTVAITPIWFNVAFPKGPFVISPSYKQQLLTLNQIATCINWYN